MSVYPYKFVPIYKERIWGGRALERFFGRRLATGKKIGESWELADLPPGDKDPCTESVVANGPDSGRTISALLQENRRGILGAARPWEAGRFPLLLKVLDANDILSLQVHPDEKAAAELGPPARAKTECWYVLRSLGGYILKGVRPAVTAEQFRLAMGSDDAVLELVERVDVKDGQFHYLPAGAVHALGAGAVVAEIQIPSDTTFRVTDWGRGREIHVQEAMRCIRFEPLPAAPPGAAGDVLLATPYFTVRKFVLAPGRREPIVGRCAAWMVLGGRGRIVSDSPAKSVPVGLLETVLIPAGLGEGALIVEEEMTFLEVTLPQ